MPTKKKVSPETYVVSFRVECDKKMEGVKVFHRPSGYDYMCDTEYDIKQGREILEEFRKTGKADPRWLMYGNIGEFSYKLTVTSPDDVQDVVKLFKAKMRVDFAEETRRFLDRKKKKNKAETQMKGQFRLIEISK